MLYNESVVKRATQNSTTTTNNNILCLKPLQFAAKALNFIAQQNNDSHSSSDVSNRAVANIGGMVLFIQMLNRTAWDRGTFHPLPMD